MKRKYFSVLLLLSFFIALPAWSARISVGTVVVDFGKGQDKNYIDVPVFNDSEDEKAYVRIQVYEIKNPGMKNEEKILVPKSDRSALIVSPQKLVIEPKGKKNIRFIALNKDGEEDRVYRVNVAPIAGDFDVKSGQYIKILVAYDILTFIRPGLEDPTFTANRKGKKVMFENLGNTNVLLRKAKQCSKDDPLECKNIAGKRLYAGAKYVQELPYDNEVEYTYSVGDKIHYATY